MDIGNKAEEMRIRIENYKRTRRMAVGPIRKWCDSLIKDAERELHRLTNDPPPPPGASPAHSSSSCVVRSTYPFSETVPPQSSLSIRDNAPPMKRLSP
jgi:hypothetical protein